MAKYDLEEDIKIYKDNRAKSLLCTRAILSVVFIVLFILGQKPYELLFIDALSYLIENILNCELLATYRSGSFVRAYSSV